MSDKRYGKPLDVTDAVHEMQREVGEEMEACMRRTGLPLTIPDPAPPASLRTGLESCSDARARAFGEGVYLESIRCHTSCAVAGLTLSGASNEEIADLALAEWRKRWGGSDGTRFH